MEDRSFSLKLDYRGGYTFGVDFGVAGAPELILDEPVPVGGGAGPAASRVLAAAAAQCLASSLIFCLRKARVELLDLGVEVDVSMERNEKGRLRIPGMRVRLAPEVAPEDQERLERCEALFEDFCIVTQSIRKGIDVSVELMPAASTAG